MSKLKSISGFLSSNVAILIILFSIIAFFKPNGFSWATNYTAIFLGVAMFGMGLTIKTQDFKVVFTRPKELALGFVLQYTIMPLSAYVLAKVFQLPIDLALGVILVGCCPGGTASNVITYIAKGDVALSVGMTILAPLCTPVLVYVLAGSWVEVSIYAMMLSAVKVVLIPVLAGILLYRLFPKQIDSIRDVLPLVSIVSIVMIISGIIGANAEKIMTCGALTFVVVMIHNGIGLLAGTAVGKMAHLDKPKTTAVAIEVGMQNSGLAISMATANFASNPLATLPGAIFSVWHNISGTIYANLCNREVKKEEVLKIELVPEGFMIKTSNLEYIAKAVILATGNKKNKPKIPGIEKLEGKGISYCAICDGFFYRNKSVAVLGNGDYAISETNDLINIANDITILTNGKKKPEFRADNVKIDTRVIKEISGEKKVEQIEFEDGTRINVNGIFIAQGVAGSTEFAKKLGAITSKDKIVVNEKMETNIKGLYACGDCTGGLLQISKAVYEGAIAGIQTSKYLKMGGI